MLTLATLCAVIGIVLGLRFRVMVLLPVNVIILATIATRGIFTGNSLLSAVLEATVAIIAVELGYMGGATATLLLPARLAAVLRGELSGAAKNEQQRERQDRDIAP